MRMQETQEFEPFKEKAWFRELQDRFNVRHVEQFAALLANPDGEAALRRLNVPIQAVSEPTERFLNQYLGMSLATPDQAASHGPEATQTGGLRGLAPYVGVTFGLDATRDRFDGLVFGSKLPDPEKKDGDQRGKRQGFFDPVPSNNPLTDGMTWPSQADPDWLPPVAFVVTGLPEVRDQKGRGTCVAFTVSAMWELMHQRLRGEQIRLSPQFLFYHCKETDGKGQQDGTTFAVALRQLEQPGICQEGKCRYRLHHDYGQRYVFGEGGKDDKADAMADAAKHRISSATRLEAGNVVAIKRAVASGRPVGLGVPVFRNAWLGPWSYLRGEISLPLVDEAAKGDEKILDVHMGSHAVCVVGYRDNDHTKPESHRPGGGYFVIRNSWGSTWSQDPREENVVPGYGILPYSYAERYWLDAYAIDVLIVNGKEAFGKQAAARKPKAKPAVAKPPAKPAAAKPPAKPAAAKPPAKAGPARTGRRRPKPRTA
jgi:hypothetical protein